MSKFSEWEQIAYGIMNSPKCQENRRLLMHKRLSEAACDFSNCRLDVVDRRILMNVIPFLYYPTQVAYRRNTVVERALLFYLHTHPLFSTFGKTPVVEFPLNPSDVGVHVYDKRVKLLHEGMHHVITNVMEDDDNRFNILSFDLVDFSICEQGLQTNGLQFAMRATS